MSLLMSGPASQLVGDWDLPVLSRQTTENIYITPGNRKYLGQVLLDFDFFFNFENIFL